MGEKKALWRTINFENLLEVVGILDDLNDFGVLPEGKHSTYYRQCLTPEGVMCYAEEILNDDEIWNRLPENWRTKFSDEGKEEFGRMLKSFFPGESVSVDDYFEESRKKMRKRMRLLVTLCDQNVGR